MKLFVVSIILIISSSVFSQHEVYVNNKLYNGNCAEIVVDTNNITQISTDPFKFRDILIENDCIVFHVAYGGGCNKVDFELITDNLIEESNPPQLRFLLKLTDNDFCKAFMYQELKFDLSKYKSYKDETGLIIKIINSDKLITYN